MARARYRSLRPEVRGVVCSTCGTDEWKWHKNPSVWKCNQCALDHAARYRSRVPAPLRLYRHAKSRAKAKGQTFSITVVDVERAWPRDNRCPALGIELKRQGGDAAPSLDRIDSTRGYEPGNVAVISMRANTIKQDATPDEVANVARWMQDIQARPEKSNT